MIDKCLNRRQMLKNHIFISWINCCCYRIQSRFECVNVVMAFRCIKTRQFGKCFQMEPINICRSNHNKFHTNQKISSGNRNNYECNVRGRIEEDSRKWWAHSVTVRVTAFRNVHETAWWLLEHKMIHEMDVCDDESWLNDSTQVGCVKLIFDIERVVCRP